MVKQQHAFTIQWLDDCATLHITWGNWLDASTIQDGTRALKQQLVQQTDARFVLFDLSHTQHLSVPHMAQNAVVFYENALSYDWVLVGNNQQIGPCEAILHSLNEEIHTQQFKSQADALAYLKAQCHAAH